MTEILSSISPLDGRYRKEVRELSRFFSEEALIKYRITVEIEYLIALSQEKEVEELLSISKHDQSRLRQLYQNFSTTRAGKVKAIEATTKHDVKAVEYYIRETLTEINLESLSPWVHFALTSEDVNNLAYSLMWKDGLTKVFLPTLENLLNQLLIFSKNNSNIAMLALTHGQPATPTTLGKEFAVFVSRLKRQINNLKSHKLQGKLGGATGTWSAHVASYSNVDWLNFSRRFIKSLGLEPNLITTQIESHDSLAESYHALIRINTILIDLCRDIWMYISRGIFGQTRVHGEVGSSTMPHKINPIHFENAEGNLGLANALLNHLATKLPVSRLQRDLSDSTVLRNQGVAMGHALLAVKSLLKGLERLTVNRQKIDAELMSHWEVLAEAIQTILRKTGQDDAYEQLKELTCGHRIDQENLHSFVSGLKLPTADKELLLALTPQTYTGLAAKLADLL